MEKKTLFDIDVYGKKVLVRVDYNVPIVDGKITDCTRINATLPTINYLLEKGASVILMSHLGRPDGKVVKKYSLKPVYQKLKELLSQTKVIMSNDVVGEDSIKKAANLKKGEVLLLENLRFEQGEELNDVSFSKHLASLGDIYVDDAFGTAHRKHASTYGVALILPSAVGFLIEKELNAIVPYIENPKHPFVGVLGGAKVSDKISIVNALIEKCDSIIIGGAMAYTFLKALGHNVGDSLVELDCLDIAKSALDKANDKGVKILLPIDHIVSKNIDEAKGKVCKTIDIPDRFIGLDIGPNTIKLFTKTIKKAKQVVWNGPMGCFEKQAYCNGTYKIAKAIAKCKGYTIVGGGDSASAVDSFGLSKKINHISTGGGASLKLFEGKVLPGIDAIQNK